MSAEIASLAIEPKMCPCGCSHPQPVAERWLSGAGVVA